MTFAISSTFNKTKNGEKKQVLETLFGFYNFCFMGKEDKNKMISRVDGENSRSQIKRHLKKQPFFKKTG